MIKKSNIIKNKKDYEVLLDYIVELIKQKNLILYSKYLKPDNEFKKLILKIKENIVTSRQRAFKRYLKHKTKNPKIPFNFIKDAENNIKLNGLRFRELYSNEFEFCFTFKELRLFLNKNKLTHNLYKRLIMLIEKDYLFYKETLSVDKKNILKNVRVYVPTSIFYKHYFDTITAIQHKNKEILEHTLNINLTKWLYLYENNIKELQELQKIYDTEKYLRDSFIEFVLFECENNPQVVISIYEKLKNNFKEYLKFKTLIKIEKEQKKMGGIK